MYRAILPSWGTPPSEPRLRPSGVDVWRIRLEQKPVDATSAAAAPRPGDASMPRERAHAAMRDILGRYLRRPPAGLPIGRRPGGKPWLDLPGTRIEFNLSHCANMALLAVSGGAGVGIDVEAERRVDDPLRLARRVLGEVDIAVLTSTPVAQRNARFLDLWTRMEARQKAVGRGIFAPAADPATLTSAVFRPSPGYLASVSLAAPNVDLDLHFFDYDRP